MTLAERLTGLRARIERAARRAGRDPAEVQLLAVSKRIPAEAVREAHALGLREFGEARVQEAAAKIAALRGADPAPRWHMIGPLQQNKARRAAELFDVVHSLDRSALAQRLARARAELPGRGPLDVFLEVNIDREPQKAGVLPEDAPELAAELRGWAPTLRWVGLMAIPRATPDAEQTRSAFARLRALRDRLSGESAAPLELSMGMSEDFEMAIEEGSSWVRIGTALFGPREPR